MNVTGPAVSALVRSERAGAARLDTLRRAAEAMDCTLVYVFIPNQGLDEALQSRAEQAARRHLAHVATTMALEDQALAVTDDLVHEQAQLLIETGNVWADQP